MLHGRTGTAVFRTRTNEDGLGDAADGPSSLHHENSSLPGFCVHLRKGDL